MGKLTEAYVELTTRDDKLRSGLGRAKQQLSAFAASMRSTLSIPVTIGTVIGGAAVTRFLVDSAKAATDLGETLNKVRVTFGQAAGGLEEEAKRLAKEFGIVRNVSLDAYANFGLIAQGAGLAADASAQMSQGLVKLAADAASFFNVPIDVALDKIRAGLIGEAEPLRAFGINIMEAKVQAKALEMGLVSNVAALTDYEKTIARATLITEGLAKASGDLERTSDSNANAMRKVTGRFEEFKTSVGEGLQDAMSDLLASLDQALAAMEDLFSPERVTTFGNLLSGVVTTLSKMGGDLADGGGMDEMFETFTQNALAALNEAAGTIANGAGFLPDNALARGFRNRAWELRSAAMEGTVPTWDPSQDTGEDPGAVSPLPGGGGGGGGGGRRRGTSIGGVPADGASGMLNTMMFGAGGMMAGVQDALMMQALTGSANAEMARLEALVNRPQAMSVGDSVSGAGKMLLDGLNGTEDAQKQAVQRLGEIKGLLESIRDQGRPEMSPAQELGVILRGRS